MNGLYEFLAMGGYGFYVWSSYLLTFVVLLLNVLYPRSRERNLIRKLIRLKQRKDGAS